MALLISLIRTVVHDIKAHNEAKRYDYSYKDTKTLTAPITTNALSTPTNLHHDGKNNDEKDLPPSYELCIAISPSPATTRTLQTVDVSNPSTTGNPSAVNTFPQIEASMDKGREPQRMSCCERKRQRRAERRQLRGETGKRGCCGRKARRCGGC